MRLRTGPEPVGEGPVEKDLVFDFDNIGEIVKAPKV